MVVIRLARRGAKKRPFYSIVVADNRRSPTGKFIERLGYFNPIASGEEKKLHVNLERVDFWVSNGAQPTDRVKTLVKSARAAQAV